MLTNAGAKVVMCEEQYVDRIRLSGAPVEQLVCVNGSLRRRHRRGAGRPRLAGLRLRGGVAGRAARRRADADLHLWNHRPAQGRRDDPRSLLFEAFALGGALPAEFGDRTTSYLPSAHIADRMLALYSQEITAPRSPSSPTFGRSQRHCPTAIPRLGGRASRVGEAQGRHPRQRGRRARRGPAAGAAAGAGRRRGQGPGRLVRVAAARRRGRAVRPGRGSRLVRAARQAGTGPAEVGGLRRGADPGRGPGVLQRPRRPGYGGLGHVRGELRRQRGAPARAPAGHGRADCCPAWKDGSPRTASSWCAGRW